MTTSKLKCRPRTPYFASCPVVAPVITSLNYYYFFFLKNGFISQANPLSRPHPLNSLLSSPPSQWLSLLSPRCRYRAAELKHGRIAMLAALGQITQYYVRLGDPVFSQVHLVITCRPSNCFTTSHLLRSLHSPLVSSHLFSSLSLSPPLILFFWFILWFFSSNSSFTSYLLIPSNAFSSLHSPLIRSDSSYLFSLHCHSSFSSHLTSLWFLSPLTYQLSALQWCTAPSKRNVTSS